MSNLRHKLGALRREDGSVQTARFYYGPDEAAPPVRTQIDPERHATWIEHDGAVGIRRGTAVSVGATPAYAQNYDSVDWGN